MCRRLRCKFRMSVQYERQFEIGRNGKGRSVLGIVSSFLGGERSIEAQ
jgi:hypothetical protein